MNPITLKDKVLEVYVKKENPDSNDLKRGIERYLKKNYSDRKLEKILEDIKSKYDIDKEAERIKSRNKLYDYIDSIIVSRIRDAYKKSREFNIDELEELEFKALAKRVLLNLGYNELYTPINNFNNVDFIVHRGNVKIAVFSMKVDYDCNVGIKHVRQARLIANSYNCDKVIIISSNYFDNDAWSEANDIDVTLINRDKFLPVVKDLIKDLKKSEKEFLLNEKKDDDPTIFLDCIIKSPKTKVQTVYIKYMIESKGDDDFLVFKGKLVNTGKRPVEDIQVNIRIFDRADKCRYDKSIETKVQRLESKEKCGFRMVFNEIPRDDWRNLCKYELRLEYRNIYIRKRNTPT